MAHGVNIMKQCTKCNEYKEVVNFRKDKRYSLGFFCWCKKCEYTHKKNYAILNKEKEQARRRKAYLKRWEKLSVYRIQNREKTNKRMREYYQLNKEKICLYQKTYSEKNSLKINEKKKVYKKNNWDKIYKKIKYKRENNIQFKLADSLRTRLRRALKANYKSGSSVRDLGCTIEELKILIEKQFEEGMTWENWKIHGWHLDHIIPLANFDLTDRGQFLKACHYTNLQPLWASDNLKKGAKISPTGKVAPEPPA